MCLPLLQRCWRCARCDEQIIDWCWKQTPDAASNDPFKKTVTVDVKKSERSDTERSDTERSDAEGIKPSTIGDDSDSVVDESVGDGESETDETVKMADSELPAVDSEKTE